MCIFSKHKLFQKLKFKNNNLQNNDTSRHKNVLIAKYSRKRRWITVNHVLYLSSDLGRNEIFFSVAHFIGRLSQVKRNGFQNTAVARKMYA